MKKILSALIISLSCMTFSFAAEPTMVGNDKDAHGCIGSAGYSWNELSQSCERPWEQKVYSSSIDFLKAEGLTCKQATDGCNRVGIVNGALGAMTEMYCEDIYGEKGQEKWSCLDTQNEVDTIGFMSQNDRSYYKTLQSRITSAEQERVIMILSTYGDKVLEKTLWKTEKSIKIIEKTVSHFDDAITELVLKTPADAAMSDSDTKKYSLLNYAKFELQIMMHRWMKNAGIK